MKTLLEIDRGYTKMHMFLICQEEKRRPYLLTISLTFDGFPLKRCTCIPSKHVSCKCVLPTHEQDTGSFYIFLSKVLEPINFTLMKNQLKILQHTVSIK